MKIIIKDNQGGMKDKSTGASFIGIVPRDLNVGDKVEETDNKGKLWTTEIKEKVTNADGFLIIRSIQS